MMHRPPARQPAPITVIAPPCRRPGRHVKFDARDDFQRFLKVRVERFFRMTGRPPRDCWQMYVKTAIIMSWFAVSYVLLVFWAPTWWLAFPLAASLGVATAAVGFNIQHDGGHRAYSRQPWINHLAATSLDLLGGSSYNWKHKHNTLHHTYANITGHDDDIDVGFLGRLSPHQKRRWFHRWQHYYLWLLYGLLPVKWQLYDDFRDVARGRIGPHTFARPRGWNLVQFIGGKLAFLALALAVPTLVHPFWTVVFFYLLTCLVEGILLSIVFQLAHVVEEADFPIPDEASGRMKNQWAVHQVATTVNFARGNPVWTWFLGGLNFQIEHHLFPRISHVHYPRLSRFVERACARYGLAYNAHAGFFAGVASHYRWLRRMGQPA
jgi:linoleoyl-CoA desaturase